MSITKKSIIVAFIVFIFSSLIVFTSVTPLRESLMRRLYVNATSELLLNELNSIESIINLRIERIRSRSNIFKNHPDLVTSNNIFDSYTPEQIQSVLIENDNKWLNNDYDLINSVLSNELSNNISIDFSADDYYLDEYGYNIFSEVFVTNKYGATVSSSVKTEDYNQSDELWWQKAKEQKIYIEGLVLDKNTNVLSITIAVAMYDNNNFLGVTKGTLNIKDIFYSVFDHRDFKDTKYSYDTFLFTKDLDLIFPLDQDIHQKFNYFLNKNINITGEYFDSNDYTVSKCINNENADCIYHWTDYSKIYDLEIKLLSAQDNTIISSLLRDSEILTLSITTLTIIVTLILFILLIAYTNRQVFYINSTLNKISKGKLKSRIKIITKDEIGVLAGKLNDIFDYISKIKIFEQTIIKHIEYPLFIFDTNKKLVFLNSASKQILDLESSKVLIGSTYDKVIRLYHRDDGPFSKNPIDTIYSNENSKVELIDLDLLVHKNKKVPVDLVASKIFDDNNNFLGLVLILRNTSDYRELDKTKSEFVSIASHQLRTPLTAIKWYTEALSKGLGVAKKPNKDQTDYLKVIQESTERIIDLVNSLLNVSRLEMGTFSVEPSKVYLREVMQTVISQIRPLIDQKNINLSTICDPKVPIVMMDKTIIQIVFENLVSNAIKYTNKDGVITIQGLYTEEKSILNKLPDYNGTAGILISVKDNGLGIPTKQQKQIFTKLFRADNVKKLEESGTGLGLYTCKLIMDKIGGAIWFESKENVGSTFYLLLPIEGMSKKSGSKKLQFNT